MGFAIKKHLDSFLVLDDVYDKVRSIMETFI